jgi:ATP phosphoribosyltransferase
MAHIVKFVVPKGTIEEATLKILEEAWQKISGRARTYRIKLSDPEIEVKLLRPQEIPTYVQEGLYDVGITGRDWIIEANADVKILLDLEYGRVKQVIAIPESFQFNNLDEMIIDHVRREKPLRISAEYLTTTANYIKSKIAYQKYFGNSNPMIITPWLRVGENKNVQIFLSFGATEAKPPEDVDAICDITETGTTLAQNNLKIIDTIMESTSVLIANKNSLNNAIISAIFSLFLGSFRAFLFATRTADDSITVSIIFRLFCVRVVPVSVISKIASTSSGGFASVAPKERNIWTCLLSPTLSHGVMIIGSLPPKYF